MSAGRLLMFPPTRRATVPQAGGGSFDHGAELPRVQVTTTYNLAGQTGTVHTVTTSGEFSTALTNAVMGDVIKIAANIDGNWTLPYKSGGGWIYIMSDYAHAGTLTKTPGKRVVAADDTQMRRLRSTAINTAVLTVATAATPARGYRLVGLEITSSVRQDGSLVAIGTTDPNDINQLPADIIIDRCYMWGDPSVGLRRHVQANGHRLAVVDSSLLGARDFGNSDSQAIWTISAQGLKVHNCALEGASENFMAGGTASKHTPADLTFTNNHFYKRAAWVGVYPCKNLFEMKFGRRVLVEGNILERCWASGQTGPVFVIKSTAQTGDGDGVQYVTEDFVARYNVCVEYDEPYRILGATEDSTQTTQRVVFRHNRFSNQRAVSVGIGYIQSFTNSPLHGVVMKNNIIKGTGLYQHHIIDVDHVSIKNTGFVFEDNIASTGTTPDWNAGPMSASSLPGTATALDDGWTGYSVRYNAVWGTWTTNLVGTGGTIANNVASRATTWDAIFTDAAGGDWTVAVGHAFKGIGNGGADPGVDHVALAAATQYCVGGQRPSEG